MSHAGSEFIGTLKPNGSPGQWTLVGAGGAKTDVMPIINGFISGAQGRSVMPKSGKKKITLVIDGGSPIQRGDLDERIQQTLRELSREDTLIRIKNERMVITSP